MEIFIVQCVKRCHCSKIRKYARHFTLPALRKEEGDERDGDDAANRGDERHLGDERRIAAVFQTEHRAETRYGHRDDNRIDVVDLMAYTTYLEQEINAQRYYHKTQERGEVYLRTANNLLHLNNLAIEEPIIIRAAGTVMLPTIVTGRAMISGV